MRTPDFTLTAGPTMASHRVLAALAEPIIFDYDPVFLERFRETERLLATAYGTTGDVVLMQGEAVLGLEAAARGLVRDGTRCLNLVSGVYAAWFGDWLRAYGGDVHEVRVPYDEALDPEAVERALSEGPFELVSIVHSETPSGVENPLEEIGRLAHEHGALMLADVVSSLGGATLRSMTGTSTSLSPARRNVWRGLPGCRSSPSAPLRGRRWRRTPRLRATRSSRCSIGSTDGSTAGARHSRTPRPSRTSTVCTPP